MIKKLKNYSYEFIFRYNLEYLKKLRALIFTTSCQNPRGKIVTNFGIQKKIHAKVLRTILEIFLEIRKNYKFSLFLNSTQKSCVEIHVHCRQVC